MLYRLLLTLFISFAVQNVFCQYSLSGRILEEKTKKPIEYASVSIDDNELWAITNEKGEFLLKNVSAGEYSISVSCLGYAKKTFDLKVSGNIKDLTFYLPQDNLALQEVVVTAKNKSEEIATSYVIDRVGLDHLQMLNVPDATSLLPGGKTNTTQHLALQTPQTLALRSNSFSGEYGNPSFGTAIEVDGVRLSNNTFYNASNSGYILPGVDTRNISPSNIESVEFITGVPSVAYGDMTNGVVKINTRKGKSPFNIEMSTNPNTKQLSLNKGFGLGRDAGTLNVNIERTLSVADPASPYTSYERNALSLLYDNTFNKSSRPLTLTFGVTGNLGGYDSKADPDAFKDTYRKIKDNTLRVQAHLNYLPNKRWITNLEVGANVNYNDKLSEEKTNVSSSSSTAVLHGQEEGYFVAQVYDEYPDAPIVLIPPGYWYQTLISDNKLLDMTVNMKARLVKKIGNMSNNILLGADFDRSGNKGKGVYYDDLRYAPTWRPYPFDELPYMNNLAVYLEDKINLRMNNESVLQVMAGIRSDITMLKDSEYGNVNSFSPRFNARYMLPENDSKFVEKLSFRAGWGKAVKLPSFITLYPPPTYDDKLVFASSVSGNESFYAYHILPQRAEYNPNLKWQYSNQLEVGVDAKLKGVAVSISAFDSRIMNTYQQTKNYEPFTYKLTNSNALDGCPIPFENRRFAINQITGIVTVSDMTGKYQSMELSYTNRNTFNSVSSYINGSPIKRRGIEWTADFDKIQVLQTSIRWDGSFNYYKALDETINAYLPNATTMMADGNPYKYVCFFVGSNSPSNGTMNKQLRSNLTFTTHIPAIRFIVSLRIESSLYFYSQNLSEYKGQPLGFVLDSRADYTPSETHNDIYAGNQYIGKYPLYYISFDDMNTKIPFAEAIINAKNNDPALYNELAKVVVKSNNDYYFNANNESAYAFANINITKEIGNFATISFNAVNFLNTMQLYKSSNNGLKTSLFSNSRVPGFYYGLSLKLKI